MIDNINYTLIKPASSLSHLVESYWMLANISKEENNVVVLPDGRVDIIFSYSDKDPFTAMLAGLGNEPSYSSIPSGMIMFAVSFKLLAVEYVLSTSLSSLINNVQFLPADFWSITKDDLQNFNSFCDKVSTLIKDLASNNIDSRKSEMFRLIYESEGSASVQDISDQVHWSSRQINRYFNEWFGLSLKAYCNILRYRASFKQISEGKLFPEKYFADQAHFIKDVKKYSGVTPKELAKNKDDRFIQFSTLRKK